jgi:arylsulfatase B
VVILADDLGWAAVSYHDPQFETPHLDQLVAEGMELNRFYVAPMCSPTRAGFMTGRYPIRFGCARAVIPPQRDFGLPPAETTIAEALGGLGYRHRGVFGKWHLGHRRAKWHPLHQGFTHFHGHYNGAIDYFQLTREGERDWHVNYTPSDEQGYSTDLIAGAAADWIRASARDDGPFFCYVPFNAPHSPFQAPQAAIDRFAHLLPLPANLGKKKPRANRRGAPVRQVLAAMIWQMDQGIGQILQAIEDTGESDNTMVWFFSDNGGVGNIPGNNRPLRGSKLTVFEGGIRVPACVRWPARVEPGSKSNHVMGYIDMLPTLVAAAGGDPDQASSKPLDGVNLLKLFEESDATLPAVVERPWFSYHGQAGEQREHLAVRLGGWKLKVNGPRLTKMQQLTDGTNEVQLFHLEVDLLEQNDLRSKRPDKVAELGRLLVEHRALQPAESVPPYAVGRRGFVPPKRWELSPDQPNRLIGRHSDD